MLRRVVPVEGGELDLDAPDARTTLLNWYTPLDREYVRLNLVTTLDGRAAGADGTSESLTSRADRTILGVIRELAGVVLVGAESVRREGYMRPRSAALAIVTASGDLTGHRLTSHPDRTAPIFVFTTAAAADRAAATVPGATVVVLESTSTDRIDLADVIASLRLEGYARIVAEGGPRLAEQLVRASLIDEVCLTVMPRLGGPAVPVLGATAAVITPLAAVQLLVDESGAQYGRWSLRA
jgi:riboflavin biosynthesis pyrimidine reductase